MEQFLCNIERSLLTTTASGFSFGDASLSNIIKSCNWLVIGVYFVCNISISWLWFLLFETSFIHSCVIDITFWILLSVLIEDTCQTQLMLETAVSHGQQGASAEYIGFLFKTNKVHYFKMISLCLAIAVYEEASLYISVCSRNKFVQCYIWCLFGML